MYTLHGKIISLSQDRTSKGMGNDPFAYEIDDDIHHYSKKTSWTKSCLGRIFEGQVGIRFLEKLHLVGLSNARLCYYGDRITNVLKEFEKIKVIPADSTKRTAKRFFPSSYLGTTRVRPRLRMRLHCKGWFILQRLGKSATKKADMCKRCSGSPSPDTGTKTAACIEKIFSH